MRKTNKALLAKVLFLCLLLPLSCEEILEEAEKEEAETDTGDTTSTGSGTSSTGTVGDDLVLTSNAKSPIGTNLGSYGGGTPEWIFIDAFLKASPWIPNFCSSDTSVNEDSNRWISSLNSGQCAATYIYNGMNGHYPKGEYVLLWEGDGSFSFERDTTFSHVKGASTTLKNGLNRATVQVNPSNNGIYMEITDLDTDYLRNFRLIMPGGICGTSKEALDFLSHCQTARGGSGSCNAGSTCYDFEDVYWDRYLNTVEEINKPKAMFHPIFAKRLKSYRGIRYMKWMSTHDTLLKEWDGRAVLSKAFYADDSEYNDDKTKTTRGIPYEAAIALSNLLNADFYITIPAQSSDEYNGEFAKLVKGQLNSNLKVYLEYSNEVWNFDYAVDRAYMLSQADARGISGGDTEFVPDGIKLARFYSERAVEIFSIWDTEFSASETKLVKILAGFVDIPYTNEILTWKDAHSKVDALSPTGYFTGEIGFSSNESTVLAWAQADNLDAFFNELNNGGLGSEGGLDEIKRNYIANYNLANPLGLRMIAYEGGFGIEAFKFSSAAIQPVTDFNKKGQLDPRMGAATVANFNNWKDAGGDEFFHFNNSDSAMTYGSLEYQTQAADDAPKYKSIMTYIKDTVCWWDDCTISPN